MRDRTGSCLSSKTGSAIFRSQLSLTSPTMSKRKAEEDLLVADTKCARLEDEFPAFLLIHEDGTTERLVGTDLHEAQDKHLPRLTEAPYMWEDTVSLTGHRRLVSWMDEQAGAEKSTLCEEILDHLNMRTGICHPSEAIVSRSDGLPLPPHELKKIEAVADWIWACDVHNKEYDRKCEELGFDPEESDMAEEPEYSDFESCGEEDSEEEE